MADIVIRGMEMPPNCDICPLHCEAYRDAFLFDPRFVIKIMQGRLQGCPLDPLPEGHGRLIDADALIREGADISDGYFVGEYCEATEWGYSTKMIENAPTIVPAEGGGQDGK